jgi:segregation and condensation protein B
VAEEPLTLAQIAASLQQPTERIQELLDQLIAEFDQPGHGVSIREVAGGYKMATKPEHHEAVRNFVKSLKPPLKLSLPALETLAVIAYKQPATGPEIMEIRGVQGGGVLKTLLDRKLIAVAGRKNVIGKPMLYKTTKEFLIQFGLKDLSELPSLKEFEEIRRMAFSDSDAPAQEAAAHEAAEPGAAITPAATTYGAAEEAPAEATEPVAEPVAEPIAEPIPELAAELIAEPPAAEPVEVAPAVEAVPKTLEATLEATPEAPPESAPVAPAADSALHEEI